MYPNLKLELFKRGIRQNHMARELRIDESILSKVIHGYREPSVSLRKMLAEYLQAEESWLFQKYEETPSSAGSDHGPNGQASKDESV